MVSEIRRGDLISIFPAIENLRTEEDKATHQEVVLNLLRICNAAVFEEGDVDSTTIEVLRKQISVLGSTELVLFGAYAEANIVSETCYAEILSQ